MFATPALKLPETAATRTEDKTSTTAAKEAEEAAAAAKKKARRRAIVSWRDRHSRDGR